MGKMERDLSGHFHDLMKAFGVVGSPNAETLERVERVTNQLAQTLKEGTVEAASVVSRRLQDAVVKSMEKIGEELQRLDRKIEDGDRSGAEAMAELISQSRDIIEKSKMILDAIAEEEDTDTEQPDRNPEE